MKQKNSRAVNEIVDERADDEHPLFYYYLPLLFTPFVDIIL
jgi:hypothetical protein